MLCTEDDADIKAMLACVAPSAAPLWVERFWPSRGNDVLAEDWTAGEAHGQTCHVWSRGFIFGTLLVK